MGRPRNAKQRRLAARQAARAAAERAALAVWPDYVEPRPQVVVCDGCGHHAAVMQNPHEVWVTPCLVCGSETCRYE